MTLSLLAKKDIQKKYMSIAFSYISFFKKIYLMCVLCVYYTYVHTCMHKHTHAYEYHSMRVEEGGQLAGVTSPGMVGSAFAH